MKNLLIEFLEAFIFSDSKTEINNEPEFEREFSYKPKGENGELIQVFESKN